MDNFISIHSTENVDNKYNHTFYYSRITLQDNDIGTAHIRCQIIYLTGSQSQHLRP